MEEKLKNLEQIIDEIDNLACALQIPLPAQMHIDSLKDLLPEKVQKLKDVYVQISGENPWE